MAGFIRRYGYFPGTEIITLIEGVVIVDLPPPGSVSGVGVGTVALVGEFADMTYGVSVDTTGAVTTKPQPVEVFSSQDMLNKVGGFDETLGDTGESGGSGFIALRNKKFSRLVIVPVNFASPLGTRIIRFLPTNKSATDPTPANLLQGAIVAAGREFKDGANRARTCAAALFTALGQYAQGIDGSVTAAGSPAPTQVFAAAGGNFLTCNGGGPVKKGDILVLGVIGETGAQGDSSDAAHNFGTFRVAADPTLATQLTIQMVDGSGFDWGSSGGSLAWRLHPASDADTGGQNAMADTGAYVVPARPLDSTITNNTTIFPTVVPPVPTATTWDPLSGLFLQTHPTAPGLEFNANVQTPNAVDHADIQALYSAAIDGLLGDDLPQREVNIVVAARHDSVIRAKLKSHVLTASSLGVGRVAVISPELTTQSASDVLSDTDPGVGANRDERVFYAWPGAQTFIPEASGYALAGADSLSHSDGMLDTHLDMWLAAVLSNLPPERNPGQASSPVPEIMAPVLAFQRGVSGLGISEYTQFRSKGIAALRFDKTAGPIFQSGVTTSLVSGQKNINRRRMADFLEDSLSQRYVQFCKQPLTDALKDSIVSETDAFLADLLSANNPPAQRINGYLIDDKSGNTPELEAKGIFVVIVKVRTTPTADFIVLQAEVGESVNVTAA